MFRSTARLAAAFVVCVAALAGGVAHAQQPPAGAPGGMQDPFGLGLSADQQKKAAAIWKKAQTDMQALGLKFKTKMEALQKKYQPQAEALKTMPPAQQAPKAMELRKKVMAEPDMAAWLKQSGVIQSAFEKSMLGILTPAQQTKFKAKMAEQRAGQPGANGGRPR